MVFHDYTPTGKLPVQRAAVVQKSTYVSDWASMVERKPAIDIAAPGFRSAKNNDAPPRLAEEKKKVPETTESSVYYG